jgi:hypothetical protein
MDIGRIAKVIAKPPILLLAFVIVLIEDVLWDAVTALGRRLLRHPAWERLERRVAQLPPYAAGACLLVPGTAALPAKLAALWLIGTGSPIAGVLLLVGVKLAATFVIARIYAAASPALLTLNWFRSIHGFIAKWRTRIIEAAHASASWKIARKTVVEVKRLALEAKKRLSGAMTRFLRADDDGHLFGAKERIRRILRKNSEPK